MYTLAFSSISSEAPFTSAVEWSIGVMTVCVLVAVVCVWAPTFIYIYINIKWNIDISLYPPFAQFCSNFYVENESVRSVNNKQENSYKLSEIVSDECI